MAMFVRLTGPAGTEYWVNPNAVASLTRSLEGEDWTELNVAGRSVLIEDSVEEVLEQLK